MSTRIIIIDEEYQGHYGDQSDSDEEYSFQGTSYEDHNIKGFKVVKKNEYHDLTVPFRPKKRTDYWLVYGIYDSGDSFSSHRGKLQLVDMYSDADRAWESARVLEAANAAREKEVWNVPLKNDDGVDYIFDVPWYGYFESLTSIEVQAVNWIYRD